MLQGLVTAVLALAAALALLGGAIAYAALRRVRRQDQLLQAANRRWGLAADSAGLGLFDWEVDGQFVELDPRACALLGVVPHGSHGCRLHRDELGRRIEGLDREQVGAALAHSAHSGEPFRVRYRLQMPDGGLRHIEGTGTLQPGTGPRRLVGVVRDITDEELRHRAELDREAAERVQRARLDFLSRLSHELRTPLNAILGFAQLIIADPNERPAPGTVQRVRFIQDAGRHLLGLVNDVLNLSAIDAGHLPMQLSGAPLQAAVDAALRMTSATQREHEIRIDNRLPAQPILVCCDARRLEQVFVNLFSNGCKYNRRGGTLAIAATVLDDGERIRVDVTDEGPGLTDEQRGQLFQPFRRLHADSSIEGTGLGLVIVKLLLEQMGGGITVGRAPHGGSVFSVELRTLPAEQAVAAPEAAPVPDVQR